MQHILSADFVGELLLELEQRFCRILFAGFRFDRNDLPVNPNQEINLHCHFPLLVILDIENDLVPVCTEALRNDILYEHSLIDMQAVGQNCPLKIVVHISAVTEAQIDEQAGIHKIALEPVIIHAQCQRRRRIGNIARNIDDHCLGQPMQRTAVFPIPGIFVDMRQRKGIDRIRRIMP